MLNLQYRSETDWDYRTANTKEFTHGIHPYPAMMIPQVARRLIQTYAPDGGTLFDPYCGSGTTLLEGILAGLNANGSDLNPLARLIAKTKVKPINLEHLDAAIEDYIDFGLDVDHSDARPPHFLNIDYWFSATIQQELALTLGYIQQIEANDIANFFKLAFSLTVRKVSWTKNSEFKLVRMRPSQMNEHGPDVFSVMVGILNDNRNAFASLADSLDADVGIPSVYGFNSVTEIPRSKIPPESVDAVVTSPPYGDSRTTVAYGQFSRLSSQWLGYQNANRVDSELMGGAKLDNPVSFGFKELNDVIIAIADIDTKRACEVASFFVDYQKSITNVSSVIKPGGHACYVVGNRTVKGIEVPTAQTTAAFFESCGFRHVDTFYRNIPNKRMPSMNSPSNIAGKLGKTMKSEIIVICQKDS